MKMKLVIIFAMLVLSISQASAQISQTDSLNWHLQQVQLQEAMGIDGYRISNNVMLTHNPTLLVNLKTRWKTPHGSFTLLGTRAQVLGKPAESDYSIGSQYNTHLRNVGVSAGIQWVTGNVGGDYDFLSFMITLTRTLKDTLSLGGFPLLYNVKFLGSGVYYSHQIRYPHQKRLMLSWVATRVMGPLQLSLNNGYYRLWADGKSPAKTWGELRLRCTTGKLPFFIEWTRSFPISGGSKATTNTLIGVHFTPYKM
ncbi:hypothetical protein H6771_02285 [Candidatus Peribacteria bacterium]|nr:hypothetical protein [Candidatus Peribacteria bacterium]